MRTLQIGLASLIAVSNLNPTSTIEETARMADNMKVQVAVADQKVDATPAVAAKPKSNDQTSPKTQNTAIVEMIKQESLKNNISPTLAIAIARCESNYRQFDATGTVIRGLHNPKDVGIFQINEEYHLKESINKGFDIYTAKGNIGYAMYLLKNQGSKPWVWSKPCWAGEEA